MRTVVLPILVLAVCLAAAGVPSAEDAAAQPPDYRAQMDAALERLRDRPGDVDAWLALNAGVRAALDADDPVAVLTFPENGPSLQDAVEAAAGRLPADPEVLRILFTLLPFALSLEDAIRDNDKEFARSFIVASQGVVERIDALIPRLSGLERLDALVTVAQIGAFSGVDPALVRRSLAGVRDELLAQVLPRALTMNACREPAVARLAAATRLIGELGGDAAPVVREYNTRECAGGPVTRPAGRTLRYRSEGSMEFTQEVDGGGTAYRVTLRGSYEFHWEAPEEGGDVRGSGSVDLFVRIEDRTDRMDCGSGMPVTLPLEISGTLTGEENSRRVRFTVRPGRMRQPALCALPEGAQIQFGPPPEFEFGDFEPWGITARGMVARTADPYRVNWTYSIEFVARLVE